jgi:hypothetical protein
VNLPITVLFTMRDEPSLRAYKAEQVCRTIARFNETVDAAIADPHVIEVATIDVDGHIEVIHVSK